VTRFPPLRALAPAKVNLCLFLGPLREDGRHELVTLFESLSLADELTLVSLEDGEDEVVCPGVAGPNLVAAALDALRVRGWTAPPVRIEVEKRIPVAAGMGGGSADAAAALRLADAMEPLDTGVAEEIARELGADVPSQLDPGLVLGTGAGEVVEPLAPLAEHAFVIVPQPFGLSTAHVYQEADRLGLPRPTLDGLRERLLSAGSRPPSDLLVNDLELAAVSLRTEVRDALEAVRAAGAEETLVCGSGPTVMGIWWGMDAIRRAESAAVHVGGTVATPVPVTFANPSPVSGTIPRAR
jgi:4-diphosphocytidyl-2-C-methyl-D-erythritol kinase